MANEPQHPEEQPEGPANVGPSADTASGDSKGGRHWFHILPETTAEARYQYAARLTEKAWSEGDRVCLYCDGEEQAQAMDDMLWAFRPDAFIPHERMDRNDKPCPSPVGILLCAPSPADWQTVIVLGRKLPSEADRFNRLALVANSDPEVLQQARRHYRELQAFDITPKVHDRRKSRRS
ncbi:DNA polymerase III subunit chi [Marinobacteraceae bacterium S3BR75-40.1]